MAKVVGVSRYYFVRLFKNSTGLTPYQYLIECRLEKAKDLLINTQLPISNIAHLSGFATHSHLTKVFQKHLSITPKIYRQMH
jgi:AraC family transcriptional regulator